MSLQSITISGFNSGAAKNKKPFLIPDDAFVELENAFVYREELRKREGLQLIGRYRRVLTSQAQANTDGTSDYTIADILSSVRATEPDSELEPSSVVMTIDPGGGNETKFTDQGDGTFLRTSGTAYQITTGTYVNYVTGEVNLEWLGGSTPAGGITVTASYNYFPELPAMGIIVRETDAINVEQTLWFDTKYCYLHDGANFQEYLPSQLATWGGTDADFFWGTNYRGSDSATRLFFVTNGVNAASSPMRYTNGSTWTTFRPIIGGESETEVLTTTLAFGSAAYAGAISGLPIVQGSVVITVTDNNGEEQDVIFRDTPKDGTLVSSGLNSGTITYSTGAITLAFNPVLPGDGNWTVTVEYKQGGTFLFSARILIPYYGRLIALNTYEGQTQGAAANIYNRARFCQIGSPVEQDAWRSDTFGKGGFVDAPTNEQIISATFYKNTLIVYFERSTWRLQYLGEYGMPFIWERISSDFGSESTFSPVLFDSGVLAVGDKAIVGSSGNDVQRVDLDIPDVVYDFKNADNGVKRVHGIRDFRYELVYWCYPDYPILQSGQYFPNKSVVYNYRNNTYAFFRNNVTCFGNFQYPANITWDRLDVYWDDYNVFWDSGIQENYPCIVCANQQGFAHFYGYPDAETSVDSTIDANDQESLSIKSVTITDIVILEIPNHNLLEGDIIYIAGLIYLNLSGSIPANISLNDGIFYVKYVSVDEISLMQYNSTTGQYADDFDVEITNASTDAPIDATYIGGGVVALFPNINIQTKDFNPAKQVGQNIIVSYIDFLFDATISSAISVDMRMNTNSNNKANLLVGNKSIESYPGNYFSLNASYTWHRFISTAYGQYLSLVIQYNAEQMNQISTHRQNFVLNAMQIYYRAAGKNIFGK